MQGEVDLFNEDFSIVPSYAISDAVPENASKASTAAKMSTNDHVLNGSIDEQDPNAKGSVVAKTNEESLHFMKDVPKV